MSSTSKTTSEDEHIKYIEFIDDGVDNLKTLNPKIK
jgi:hypothetical protein